MLSPQTCCLSFCTACSTVGFAPKGVVIWFGIIEEDFWFTTLLLVSEK